MSKTMQKIYKYTSLKNAVNILDNNAIKCDFSSNYNDPFDSVIDIRQKDVDKSLEIITEYYVAQEFLKLFSNKEIKVKNYVRILMNFDRFVMNLYLNANKRNKYYDSIPVVRWVAKLMIRIGKEKNEQNFKKIYEEQANSLFEIIIKLRDEALICCFSKRSDSILMWSHYADDHKGVCIEFERPKKDFIDVRYSKKRNLFDLEYITRKYLGHLLSNEMIDKENKNLIKSMIKPFMTKSKDWAYEKEVRSILSKKSEEIFEKDGYTLFKMQTLPTKIFIGCKVNKNSEDYKRLIKCAEIKGIEIIHMEVSESVFAVIPSNNC